MMVRKAQGMVAYCIQQSYQWCHQPKLQFLELSGLNKEQSHNWPQFTSCLVCAPSALIRVGQSHAHSHQDLQQVLAVHSPAECIPRPWHWGWAQTQPASGTQGMARRLARGQKLPQQVEEKWAEPVPGLCYSWQAFPCSWDNKREIHNCWEEPLSQGPRGQSWELLLLWRKPACDGNIHHEGCQRCHWVSVAVLNSVPIGNKVQR